MEDGWYYGRLVEDGLPEELRRDLKWYDEVVSQQMLSYLDDAVRAVERHGLSVRLPDGSAHKLHALHLDGSGETSFRITPVPPSNATRIDSSTILG